MSAERLADRNDTFFVGPTSHHGTISSDQFSDAGHLAGRFQLASFDDVEAVVKHYLLAYLEQFVELGVHRDAHLASSREHVGTAVVFVQAQKRSVTGRCLGQLVDLFSQGGDTVAGLTQGIGELFVARYRLGELALCFEQALF